VGGIVSAIRLTFQESIAPGSFDLGDVVGFQGPQGPIPVTGVSPVAGSMDRQFDVTFAPQATYGIYAMVIGPAIQDLAGNAMDQNQNGINGEVPGDQYTASFTLGERHVFVSPDVPKSLKWFSISTSTLTIDEELSIADVDVRIDVAYQDVGLLDVWLVAPSGTTVSLAPATTFVGADYQDTVFDDEAAVPISSGSPPFAGSFRPASPLSALDGQSTRGTWQLCVNDLWFWGGLVNAWSLAVLANPPRLSISDAVIAEGDSGSAEAEFVVSLSNVIGEPVTVDFATADGTATAGSDYDATSGTLTFLPGELAKTICVPIRGDLLDEPDETFFVTLANAGRATIEDAQAVGVIRNDEAFASVGDASLWEGNNGTATAVFTVGLSSPSSQTVTVGYATADDTAEAGSDYTTASGTLSFAPGEVAKTIAVSVLGDALNEADETFFLRLIDSTNALVADHEGQATLANDDPIPALYVNDVTLSEGDSGAKNLSFLVSLTGLSGRTITVPYWTSDGTATAGEDYTTQSGTLTILPGQGWRTVYLAVNGDTTGEPDETLLLNLGTPTNAILLDPQAVGTIRNDDTSITIADAAMEEGDSGPATRYVTVTLSQAVGFPVSVGYATASNTAAVGSDLAPAAGTLTFVPGQTTAAIPVDVIGDLRNEGDESFYVTLSQPTNALLGDAQALVTILDDDLELPAISLSDVSLAEGQSGTRSMTFTLSLSAPSGRSVSVDYATADLGAGPGCATAGSDYVAKSGSASFAAGATTASVSITVNGDTAFEGDESFVLNLSSPANATLASQSATGTILDDDSLRIDDVVVAEGNDGYCVAAFTVSLAAALPYDVALDYATANGTAASGSDYAAASGRATIAAGSTSIVIPVLVLSDPRNEPDETFCLNLSNATGAVLADTQGIATIVNDDPLPTVSVSDVTLSEGGAGTKYATFTVALSAPAGRTLSVGYATADGTATAGSDYTAKSGTLLWYAGFQTATVNVAVSGDAAVEGDETVFLRLSSPWNVEIAEGEGVATIVNDDPLPALAVTDAKVTEGNAGTKYLSFNVSLSAVSAQTVAVQYGTADGTATAGSDYAAQSGTLTFTPGQYSKSVSVALVGDAAVEPDETFFIRLSNPTNAFLLDSEGLESILNDDTGIAISDAVVTEGAGGIATATFVVSLSSAAGHEVRVDYSMANGTATANSDCVFGSGTLVFPAGVTTQAIAVAIPDDQADEADETFYVRLANPVAAQIARSQGVATILDNDPLPAISVADVVAAEGASGAKTLSFVLKLSCASGRSVTVAYATANGTATAGSDYVARSGSVSFPAGSTSQTVAITVNGDTVPEPDETLLLNLTSPVNATLAEPQAVGTLLDDDCLRVSDATALEGDDGAAAMVFVVSLAVPLPYEVRLDYATANGTAYAGSDYAAASGTLRFAPGQTSQQIAVMLLGNRADEADETLYVILSNAVGTILADSQAMGTIVDDDALPSLSITDVVVIENNAGASSATFTVALSCASGRSVTVDYATSSEGQEHPATVGTDYTSKSGTLTFSPGTLSQRITVAIQGDLEIEADETFCVTLSGAASALVAKGQGQATILNDDGDAGSSQSIQGRCSDEALLAFVESDLPGPRPPRKGLLRFHGALEGVIQDRLGP